MSKIKKIALFFIIGSVLFFSLSFYSFSKVNSLVISNQGVIHNSYIAEYDISNTSLDNIDNALNEIEKKITSREVSLFINDREYKYSIYELGIGINKTELKQKIYEYENTLDYWDLYNNYSSNSFDKIDYNYEFVISESKLDDFLTKLKNRFDVEAKKGHLKMQNDRELKYVGEATGYNVDSEKTRQSIIDCFSKNECENIKVDVDKNIVEDYLKSINTKISSFTTTFDNTVDRKYNLIAGAKLLDGKIVEPHTEFSFFENAGPYTGINDYVYYLGVMGNGVCQVATTLYNAELLGGLTTVERYNHGKKSVYVDGGLDATVAVTGGYVTDFRFRNDYDYPVYISAFVNDDKLTVELWSNDSVKNGNEYKTESVKLGYGAYKAYRHTYKDGELVNTENLGTSYYFSE